MIAWLLEMFAGKAGLFAAAGVAIATGLGYLAHLLKKAGRDGRIAEEANARDENLQRIKAAKAASDAARTGNDGLSDPRNRDNKRV